MNSPNQQPTLPNFDEDFLQAQEDWKQRHKVRDDDTILALMDLFRIHQSHWDEIRHRQMPSLDKFKADIMALTEAVKTLKERAAKELRVVELPAAIIAAFTAAVAGFLIGKFL